MDLWMNKWKNEWVNEWTNEWMSERMNEWVNELMSERVSERMNWILCFKGGYGAILQPAVKTCSTIVVTQESVDNIKDHSIRSQRSSNLSSTFCRIFWRSLHRDDITGSSQRVRISSWREHASSRRQGTPSFLRAFAPHYCLT